MHSNGGFSFWQFKLLGAFQEVADNLPFVIFIALNKNNLQNKQVRIVLIDMMYMDPLQDLASAVAFELVHPGHCEALFVAHYNL